jgi:hypothetical protein
MKEKEPEKGHLLQALDEIAIWRTWYLKNKFTDTNYAFVADKYKERLKMYFMVIPSQDFETPEQAWDVCLNSLLSYIGEEKGD